MRMNARDRVLAAIRRQPVDRVPTDIWATEEVWVGLERAFGSRQSARERLHIDGMAYLAPPYVGPALPSVPEGETVNFWGMRHRRVQYATGVYWEQYHHPLARVRTRRDMEEYRWPSPDWFDYSALAGLARNAREKQAVLCGYMAPFYYHNLLRGLEQSLMDPHDDAELTHAIIEKISGFFQEHHRRIFETCRGLIDVAQVTDDYGSQTGPLIGMETFRSFYKAPMQGFIDLCREHGVHVFHHDDGAIRPFLPEFIAMGIEILNPVQHTCPGMDRVGLKRDFGKRICFHGGIDNQKVLPFGTPEEVRAEVRASIDALASDGTGYILAPCHNLQAVSPLANIVAMYEEAWTYGAR